MKSAAFITGLITFSLGALILALFFYTKNSQAISDTLIISEIGIGSSADSQADFVRLYNLGSSSLSLKGWRLVKRSSQSQSDSTIKAWADEISIAPGASHIWANNDYSALTADSRTSQTLAKDNCLALRQGAADSGQLIDAVGWGNCSQLAEGQPTCNPGEDGLIKRLALSDSDNNLQDFGGCSQPVSSQSSAGSTGGGASQTAATVKLFFNELCPNPSSGREWLELRHENSQPVDLSGYYLQDASGGKSKLSGSYPPLFLLNELSLSLNNDQDSLRLFSPDGQLLDSVSYSPAQAPAKGQSLILDSQGLWQISASPSPGSDNIIDPPDTETKEAASHKTLMISEILPNPNGADSGGAEFIEIFNAGASTSSLTNYWLLVDGQQQYRFGSSSLAAGQTLALRRTDSGLRLANEGGEVRLLDPQLKLIDKVKYPSAPAGLAWARNYDLQPLLKDWLWTLTPSPGASNSLMLPNRPPVALIDCPSDSTWLDGSDSYDPDGQPLSWQWQWSGLSYAGEHWELPPGSQGVVHLTVSDGQLSDSVDCRLNGQSPNKPTSAAKSTSKTTKTSKTASTSANKSKSTKPSNNSGTPTVSLSGWALCLPGQLGSQYFYLLDTQGRSWQIYQHRKQFPRFDIGQALLIHGRLSDSQPERLLVAQAGDIQQQGKVIELVAEEKRLDEIDASLAGQLITVSGQVSGKKGQLLYLDDGYGELTIALSPDLSAKNLNKGQLLSASGILRLSGDSLKLQLRQASDLSLKASASSTPSSSIALGGASDRQRYWLLATAILLLASAALLLRKKSPIKNPPN